MGYVPIVLVGIIPTIIAFWFAVTRPHLGVRGRIAVFIIWIASSVPLGGIIFAFSALFYLSTVGYGAWDAKPREAYLAVAAPLSILLNGSLMLIA